MRVFMNVFVAIFVLSAMVLSISVAKAETFSVPELGYAFDALEPVIDAKTMETHVTKHHQGYVNKLNKAVLETPAIQDKSLEEILSNVSAYSSAVRNNAGGHWSHRLFWSIMAPENQTGDISSVLGEAIIKQFGSLDAMKEAFIKAGSGRFGSGWVWLIVKDDQTLDIVSTPNQDNPLMDDAPVKGTPILGNDVWEHAYYLNYQNRRGDYLNNWWRVVNWEQVSKLYIEAISTK